MRYDENKVAAKYGEGSSCDFSVRLPTIQNVYEVWKKATDAKRQALQFERGVAKPGRLKVARQAKVSRRNCFILCLPATTLPIAEGN